jgi:hypothetical protein
VAALLAAFGNAFVALNNVGLRCGQRIERATPLGLKIPDAVT